MKHLIPVLALTAVLLAGCGTGAKAPLTARHLAAKIPGCSPVTAAEPAVMEKQDVTCILRDGALVSIGTFATAAGERKWIADGGSPVSPDPAFAGCCVQGNGWAATVGLNNSAGPMDADFRQVIRALGGRMVTG